MLGSRRGVVLKRLLIPATIIVNAVAAIVSLASVAQEKTGVMSIAQARSLPLKTVVTIEGLVTVPPGTFRSSMSDEGFAIQDRSDGIYVRMSVNPGLDTREQVRVTGALAESNGLLTVVPASAEAVRKQERGPEVAPQTVQTGKIGETTEGRLVKVRGMITRAVVGDAPYGARLFINDGTGEIQIYVSASTKIDLSGLQPGQRVRVTGFSGQYKDHYEVEPRVTADIVLLNWKRRPAP